MSKVKDRRMLIASLALMMAGGFMLQQQFEDGGLKPLASALLALAFVFLGYAALANARK